MGVVSVYIQPDDGHLHREVITDASGGNVTARSVEFDIVDTDRAAIAPRERVPQSHEAEILSHLEDDAYDDVQRHPA